MIPLSGDDAKKKLQKMEAKWAIVQEARVSSLSVINAVKELNKETKLIMMNWAIDENIAKQAPDLGKDRIYGIIPYGVWADDLPAVKLLHKINAKYHPDIPDRTCRYIQGYINTKILLEAIERAGNDLTSKRIRKELQGLKNFDTGASFNRVTYSEEIHKPSSIASIYTIKDRTLVPIKH